MSDAIKQEAEQEQEIDLGEVQVALRTTEGFLGTFVFGLGVVLSIAHIYFNTLGTLSSLEQNSIHFAGFAILCAILYPLSHTQNAGRAKLFLVMDIALGLMTAFAAIYMVSMEDAIYARGVKLAPMEWACGIFLILSAIEFTRRTTGFIIPVLIVLALTYSIWWGDMIDGVFRFSGLSAETVLFRSIYGDDGLFGNIALISSTFVFMFILFGAFLLQSGAGDFIIDLARCVAGRLVGGPGLVAVIASGLTGTISGSAVANTASTGVITIPLMKKAGFPAKFAGGVEAAASTGGQLMPPIMGAGAFVMASNTQIPYTTIIAVSLLPALLYFFTVGFFVRIEAKRNHITGGTDNSDVKAIDILKKGGPAFLLPIGILIGLLIYGFTPTYAAGFAIISVVVSSWMTPNKMGLRAILDAMVLGSRNMVMTAVLLCSVGLVVNVIAMTGIGNTFSLMIQSWAGDSLVIAIILIGLASLVLGMGLPVTAAYIVLATLSAPALYNLITDGLLTDALVNGTVAEEAKALFMLAIPDKLDMLNAPMSLEDAKAILAAIPVDMIGLVKEQTLDASLLTMTLLSAHMIIFWLSQDSNVTPPVCLTAFTAAAIAHTKPMATGLQSWKIAKGLYIVPLLFAYTPFLGGTFIEVITIFAFALLGLYAFTAALQGHLEAPLNWPMRILTLALATVLLWPAGLMINLAGAAAFIALFVYSWRQDRLQMAKAA